MTMEILSGLIAIVINMITIVSVVVKLNSNLVRLACAVEELSKDKVDVHQKIDEHQKTLSNHEIRIVKIEEKN